MSNIYGAFTKSLSKILAFSISLALFVSSFTGCQSAVNPTPSVAPTASLSAQATPSEVAVIVNSDILYTNTQYGFSFTLPNDWKGYTIIEENWQGTPLVSTSTAYSGPEILIRNPSWTQKDPMLDIPIMVFAIDQWDDLKSEKFHIGAAPINPSELGRNSKYVFALPARYNFSYLKGWDEVDKIIQSKALKPII